MNIRSGIYAQARWVLLVLMAASAAALGADKTATAEARAVYERDLAVCNSNQSNQDRATCLREANAAYAEARRGGPTGDATQFSRNALKRCDPLPEDQRKDCIARMQGQGTTSGSVSGGGIYRELVTREPAAAASAPAVK